MFARLEELGESEIYPYHMPGHKRHPWGRLPPSMYQQDITEIDGFDNLHQPEGILRTLQERAAQLYGSAECYYLVNGSTSGILSAVSGALPPGGHILMARNCHKSAYHAAYLRKLQISYLYPPWLGAYGILDAVTPGQVQEALDREPGIGAVLVVSPTYEGRIADIRGIARVVHRRGIPLIVDEAHGAHLGLAEGFAENSCQAGADLVIHSVHKTLPALTQTALLHVNGQLVDRGLVRRFLQIYQSSSPSYLLMASIDNALDGVIREGDRRFSGFLGHWQEMERRLGQCRHLEILPGGVTQDVGKLLICVKDTDMTGRQLYDRLLTRYHLQMEMASEKAVLAMFTVNDTPEGYTRLTEALLEIDQELANGEWQPVAGKPQRIEPGEEKAGREMHKGDPVGMSFPSIPLAEAWDMEKCQVPLEESVGRYAAGFVNLYPPGIPVLVPGEIISTVLHEKMQKWICMGLTVQGVEGGGSERYLEVLKAVPKKEISEPANVM